jgi:hypothetical protein
MAKTKIKNTIVAICEGLLGKLLFNSKIDISEAYSEYMLYEPIVQIAKRNWNVESEVSVKSLKKKGRGDNPKIDFILTDPANNNRYIALEVKYAKGVKSTISVDSDIKKLLAFKNDMISKDTKAFLMILWKEHSNRDVHLNRISQIDFKRYHECSFETNLKQRYFVTVFEICTKR